MSPNPIPQRNRRRIRAWLIAGVVAAAACGAEAVIPAVVNVLLVSNSWAVVGSDPERYFQFNSDDDGKPEGTFSGFEGAIEDNTETTTDLTGYWESNTITFTVEREVGDETYVGTSSTDLPTELVVTSPNETITITRGGS
jgi:hypothetical protein